MTDTAPTVIATRRTGKIWSGYDFHAVVNGVSYYIAFATKHATGYNLRALHTQFPFESKDLAERFDHNGAELTAAQVKDRANILAGVFVATLSIQATGVRIAAA